MFIIYYCVLQFCILLDCCNDFFIFYRYAVYPLVLDFLDRFFSNLCLFYIIVVCLLGLLV